MRFPNINLLHVFGVFLAFMGIVLPVAYVAATRRSARSKNFIELLKNYEETQQYRRKESDPSIAYRLEIALSDFKSEMLRQAKHDYIPWFTLGMLFAFCVTEFFLALWLGSQLHIFERLPFFEGALAGFTGKMIVFLAPLAISSLAALLFLDDPAEPILVQTIKAVCLFNVFSVIAIGFLMFILYFADRLTHFF